MYIKPWLGTPINVNTNKRVIIIGGGISGASTAYALSGRGYSVTLYEQHPRLAMEASGNAQAILYANFLPDKTPINELNIAGYCYSHSLITELLSEKTQYAKCGLIDLAHTQMKLRAQTKLIKSAILPADFCYTVNKAQIKQISGIEPNYAYGLYFPQGLWLNPASLIQKLVSKSNIKIVSNQKIEELEQIDDTWQLINGNQIIDSAENIVLCNAANINMFKVTQNINLRLTRGQISYVKSENNASITQSILSSNSYITPPRLGAYTIGASFDFKHIHSNLTIDEHITNLKNAKIISGAFSKLEINDLVGGKAGIRASSYDYLPIVGPIAHYDKFKLIYAKLAQDKNSTSLKSLACPYHRGLYLNIAHGSKGMLSAPICGEIIAGYIDNNILPKLCSEQLRIAIHPNRLYARGLIKHFM